jgi:hypothetical protein
MLAPASHKYTHSHTQLCTTRDCTLIPRLLSKASRMHISTWASCTCVDAYIHTHTHSYVHAHPMFAHRSTGCRARLPRCIFLHGHHALAWHGCAPEERAAGFLLPQPGSACWSCAGLCFVSIPLIAADVFFCLPGSACVGHVQISVCVCVCVWLLSFWWFTCVHGYLRTGSR